MKKNKLTPARNLKLHLFLVGAIFLFNPLITIIDVLPDFVGAILFILALGKIRDLSEHLEDARKNFLRFFWLNLSRIPAYLLMFWVSHNYSAEGSIILVFTFCYAVFETVLLAVSFNALFEGFIYIGERNEGSAVLTTKDTVKIDDEWVFATEKAQKTHRNGAQKKKRRPLGVSGVKNLTLATFLLLRLLSVLPELVYVSDDDFFFGAYQKSSQIQFKGFYTLLAFIPAIILGIIWLVKFRKYIRGICADSEFCTNLLNVYSKRMPADSKIHVFRRYLRYSIILSAFSVFALDLFIDNQNVIPDIVASAVLLSAAIYFSLRLSKLSKGYFIIAGMSLIFDILSQAFYIRFTSNHVNSDVFRVPAATSAYFTYFTFDTLATLSVFLGAIAILIATLRFINEELFSDERSVNSPRIRMEIHDIKRRTYITSMLAVLNAISSVFYRLTVVDTRSISVAKQEFTDVTHLYVPRFEMYWLVDFVLGLCLIAAVLWILEKTKDSLKFKYLIDE